MLRQCRKHGHFSGTNCPVCNEEGKLIMSDREAGSLGRMLALVLRHAPEKFNVEMDINGWVDIREFVDALRDKEQRRFGRWLRPHHIKAVVEYDGKGRYEVRGNTVRATYGHTVEIELDLPCLLYTSPSPRD